MEDLVMNNFMEGVKYYLSYVNWLFVVCFMFWGFVINTATNKAAKKTEKTVVLKKIPTRFRMIILGIGLAFIFVWLFDIETKDEYAKLFFSIPLAMFIWSMFFKKMVNKWTNKQTNTNIVSN